jgi:hypothetical protein
MSVTLPAAPAHGGFRAARGCGLSVARWLPPSGHEPRGRACACDGWFRSTRSALGAPILVQRRQSYISADLARPDTSQPPSSMTRTPVSYAPSLEPSRRSGTSASGWSLPGAPAGYNLLRSERAKCAPSFTASPARPITTEQDDLRASGPFRLGSDGRTKQWTSLLSS